MIRDIDGSARAVSQEFNVVYKYLRQSATVQAPLELTQNFKTLLQNGRNADARVSRAFEKIVFASEGQFVSFLNQCFYIILDIWVDRDESLVCIDRLIKTLNAICKTSSYDRRRKQLIQQIWRYQQSQSYLRLKLVTTIIDPTVNLDTETDRSIATNESGITGTSKTPLIDSYLSRYPFLYPYLLPADISAPHISAKIEWLQSERQKEFEIQLSKHIIYRFRLKQIAKMKMMSQSAGKIITKSKNPSLLSERAFRAALQQYVGKSDRGNTLQERAQLFIAENQHRKNYGKFKLDFGRFLTHEIEPRSSTYHFKSRLSQKLAEIFPQANDKPLNQTQILQTCRQLLSYLIVDPALTNSPQQFAELVVNLGTAQAMLTISKIILICPEAKADLEKKLYLIVDRYQLQTVQQTPWLLKSLEHLLIFYSIHFGHVDVSMTRAAIAKL